MASTTENELPTIEADMQKYEDEFKEPSFSSFIPIQNTNFSKACASDIGGKVGGTLREFLKKDDLPPYYKFKASMALSGVDEEKKPWENLAATHHFLKKAEEAVKLAKETYVHDLQDTLTLEAQSKILEGEWEELRQRQKDMDSSDDRDDIGSRRVHELTSVSEQSDKASIRSHHEVRSHYEVRTLKSVSSR